MRKVQIALARGDGAGPEMMEQAVRITRAAACLDDIELEYVETPMGWCALEQYGDTLPQESYETATRIGTLFFGSVGVKALDETLGKQYPKMKPEPRCLRGLRGGWELLCNLRPIIYYPEVRHLSLLRDLPPPETPIEQYFLRFLLEDAYFGNADLRGRLDPSIIAALGIKTVEEVTGDESIVTDLAYYTAARLERFFQFGFAYAAERGLPVLLVDKKNMMGRYVLWSSIATRIHREKFVHVPLRHAYADDATRLLFHPAMLHGVILCGNEHGDFLTDGAAECFGSMGMMCSASVNPITGQAMFESGAGTAAELAGRDVVNPIGRILTGALMLKHIGAARGAAAIEKAVRTVLQDGARTADIAKPGESTLRCSEMGNLIAAALKHSS